VVSQVARQNGVGGGATHLQRSPSASLGASAKQGKLSRKARGVAPLQLLSEVRETVSVVQQAPSRKAREGAHPQIVLVDVQRPIRVILPT